MKWGTTNTESQSWETTVNLEVPAGEAFKVTATVTETNLNVPFVAKWKSVKTGEIMTMKGVFKGISSSDLDTEFVPVEM